MHILDELQCIVSVWIFFFFLKATEMTLTNEKDYSGGCWRPLGEGLFLVRNTRAWMIARIYIHHHRTGTLNLYLEVFIL